MALDPSIALAYKPPEINVPIPQPLQQFGQILTLRNLMQQGQLFPLELATKQLGLQQAQLAYKQAMGLADLFQNPDTTAAPGVPAPAPVTPTPAAPAAPGSFVMAQGQGGNAVHSLDGGASWVDSATGAPYSGSRYAETPVGAGIGGALPPPAPPPTAAPTAAAPAAPAVPGGGIPGLPSWQRMIQVGGASAFPWIKNINEARTAQLDQAKKQLDLAKGESEDMVRLGNAMTTNEFKNQKLVEAAQKHYISWDDVRKYSDMDVNDPRFQAQKESWGQSALTYDQSVKLANDRLAEKRAENEEMRKWVEFTDNQNKESERRLREKVNTMSDPKEFPAMLTTPYLQNQYGSLIGKSADDIKIGTGAGKPGETVPFPTSVAQQKVSQAAATAGAETTSRIGAENAQYRAMAEQVKKDPGMWPTLNTEQQNRVGPLLPQGFPYTTKLEPGEASTLFGMQKSMDAISKLNQEFAGGKYDWITGPFLGAAVKDSRYIPHISAEAKGLGAKLGMLESTVGDLIKGGVLRESDREAYKAMFPNQTDTTENIKAKLGALTERLQGDLDTYKGILRSQRRLLPGETPGAAPAGAGPAPTPTGPSYQTIEKTGAPGPKVTGTITIGGAAPAAPPGKIPVYDRSGNPGFIDADKWGPAAEAAGYTRR